MDNFRLPDLAEHLIDGDPDELYDAVYQWGDGVVLADLTDFANMTLADLPVDSSLFRKTVLNDVKAGLSTVTFEDLALALLAVQGVTDPVGELETVVDDFGVQENLTLADFATFGNTTFSELLPAFGGGQLGDLGAFLAFIHLGDLNLFTPQQLSDALATAGTGGGAWLVRDAVNDPNLNLGDMKIVDIIGAPQWGAATVKDLVDALPDDEVTGFTFSDLLLGLLPPGALPWGLAFEKIDAEAIPGVMSPITLSADFALRGVRVRSVELSVELPTNAAFVAGSATVTPVLAGADLNPTEVDGRLVWTFSGIEPGPDAATPGQTYTVDFDVQPTLAVGSTAVHANSRVLGGTGSVSSTTYLQVLEAFEPNNVPAQAVQVTQDVIYLVHIPSDTDIDLFSVDLLENDALAVDLSGLPADFDLVLYRENNAPAGSTALTRVAPGDALIPVIDPDADGTESVPDQGFPRLDLIYPNLSLVEISNSRGNAKESIVTDRLAAGRYLIQVHGHDAANSVEPAVLQINIIEAGEVPVCAVRGTFTSQPQPGRQIDLANLPADLNTVILVNKMRFEQMYPGRGNIVMDSLDALVAAMRLDPEIATLGLSAVVVAVDGYQSVRDGYAFWDDPASNGGAAEDACSPAAANGIVSSIVRDVLDPIRDIRDIENVVLVGSDDLLPFARLNDETQVANEFDYRNDLRGRNSFTGALWSSTFLSDDPYGETGAQAFGDRFLYVADAALGRVLESPEQIADQIQQFIDFDGYLAADSALVAGYDFLVDGSEAIAGELKPPRGPISAADVDDSLADGLNGNLTAWDRADITTALLGDVGSPIVGNGPDLVSFNAHFDHYRALPAAGDKVVGFNDNFETSAISDLIASDPRFDGSVIFSMGCHSGLNVPNLTVGVQGVKEDWAEVFTEQLAVYVGNTGFGYGDTDTVGYTERLMQLFARNVSSPIATDLGDPSTATSIGDAMKYAKQQAFSELTDVSVYHEKAYQESTFYGLPFFRVGVAPVLPPPAPINNPEADPITGELSVLLTADPDNTPTLITRDDGDVETYFSNLDADGDESIITQPGRPLQPALAIDVSDLDPAASTLLEREARGAIILDMTSSYQQVDPVVAVPVFDESSPGVEPAIAGIVFPTVPQRISTFETPAGTRQKLLLATGQYRGTETTGQQRLDDDIDVVVYYADINEPDRSAPRVLTVDPTLVGAELSISVHVDDGGGTEIDRVYVLVTPTPNTPLADWFGVELVDAGAGQWSGGITFDSAPNDIELLVQAKDRAGNVGVSTNKAINYGAESLVELPTVSLTSTVTAADPQVNGIHTGPVTITAQAGGLPVTYRLNNSGAFQELDPINGVVVSGDRTHKVEIVALDGQRQTLNFAIDTAAPAVTITKPFNASSFAAGAPVLSQFRCVDSSSVTCVGAVSRDGGPPTAVGTGEALPSALAGSYVLTVTGTDSVNRVTTRSVTYQVDAIGPIVTITSPASDVVGVGSVLLASFECVDAVSVQPSCEAIATGPGLAGAVPVLDGEQLPTGVAGSFLFTVHGVDDVGNETIEMATYTVTAASSPPQITVVGVPSTPQLIDDGVDVDVEFIDSDGTGHYTVTIDYGDADPNDPLSISSTCTISSTMPTATGNPACQFETQPGGGAGNLGSISSHFRYPRAGVYTVTITVVDGQGLRDEWAYDQFIVVYDPDAGGVSGSGMYWSDDSSYDDIDRHGEWAFFGYDAKYKNNGTLKGETELLLLGDFYFKSTAYDYLIVNDTLAVAEGVGRFNGRSGYRFRVQGIDNGRTDFFQLTVWEDGNPANVVYDNGVLFSQNGSASGNRVLLGGIRVKS